MSNWYPGGEEKNKTKLRCRWAFCQKCSEKCSATPPLYPRQCRSSLEKVTLEWVSSQKWHIWRPNAADSITPPPSLCLWQLTLCIKVQLLKKIINVLVHPWMRMDGDLCSNWYWYTHRRVTGQNKGGRGHRKLKNVLWALFKLRRRRAKRGHLRHSSYRVPKTSCHTAHRGFISLGTLVKNH